MGTVESKKRAMVTLKAIRTSHYQILVNKFDNIGISLAYIPEEVITIIIGYEVLNAKFKAHFTEYDGIKYIMKS